MPLNLVRADITTLSCDAIVNAANTTLLGGGGVDGAIHRAAGPELLRECETLGGCRTGEAKITKGYDLPSRFVIHTVGPVWQGGTHGEEALLRSCYRSSLSLAEAYGLESVAFPLISAGAYGYPKDQALRIAVDEISRFLSEHEMRVSLVIFDRSAYSISEKLFSDVASFIDDRYVDEHVVTRQKNSFFSDRGLRKKKSLAAGSEAALPSEPALFACAAPEKAKEASLDEALRQIDESFSEMLLRKIDEKGITDAACYKKANVDRKLFSKIRGDKNYRPKKTTAIAFAIALELPLAETKDLLMKAGFALSHSSKFDIIIEYFITHQIYNVFEINEALFAFDQALLGV